jgi:Dolichyl-phosphate-mannose-protein mannosyltransferase
VTTKRAKPRAPLRAADRAGAQDVTPEDESPRLFLWLGLAWLVGFSLYYYSFTLPNNHLGRLEILFMLPSVLPVSALGSAQWGNLWQRADLIGVALLIWVGAWGLGELTLRAMRLEIERVSLERTYFAMALGLCAVSLLTLGLGLAGLLNRWIFIGVFAAAVVTECALRFGHLYVGSAQWRTSLPSASEKPGRGRRQAGGRQETVQAGSLPYVGVPFASYRTLFWIALIVVVPFLFVMWFGSMTPDAEFDVRSYHFEGPKEYFQNGRITFLPHNVYTNFPFLSEMFALLGMVIEGDWYWGAVAGKSALFAFVPLTALGLFAAGRRWFSPAAGILAAVVYLTTPWIDRVTLQALAEGSLTFFLFATLFAAMRTIERMHGGLSARRWSLMTGLLAGAGMACKYTGLMQVVIPAAIGLVGGWWFFERQRDVAGESDESRLDEASRRREPAGMTARQTTGDEGLLETRRLTPAARSQSAHVRSLVMNLALFAAGVALTTGPWLLKNVVFTGNPVYPLAYTMFGGRDWTPALNAKFVPAHSPHDHHPLDLGTKFIDVMADNDWSSPLLFALAPCALLAVRGRRISLAVGVLVVYLIVTYWAFTHRIDRFWVPLIPAAALLAGVGAAWSSSRAWVWSATVVIGLAVWFNLGMEAGTGVCSGICGYNAYLSDRQASRRTAEGVNFFVAYMNRALPAGSKVLCVGDQEVFDARFPVVYNTVFNPSFFQAWCAAPTAPPGTSERDWPLKPAPDILAKLHAEGVTHVYVNWDWIRRYRDPSNYGYTDFVRPDRFDRLVSEGVLRSPVSLGCMNLEKTKPQEKETFRNSIPFAKQCDNGRRVLFTGTFDALSDDEMDRLKAFGPSLFTKSDGNEVLINAQLFPVK